ncbi:MAG: alpha/beta hydrolase [Bacteroidetes bacterium]|nr:alpha/beta hydrolase [Bacteroidota bacterium]
MKKVAKYTLYTLLVLFIFLNIVAYRHSVSSTTYENCKNIKIALDKLSTSQKLKMALSGMTLCKSSNDSTLSVPYKTIIVNSNNYQLECWKATNDSTKGTMILFHGYGTCKSYLKNHAEFFYKKGYTVFLVDFYGAGGSSGNSTTIGYNEAINVKDVFDFVEKGGEENIYIYAQSMGAAATLKAIKDYGISPKAILLESPFDKMYAAVTARFKLLKIPPFPMAAMLTFWGGVKDGFWAFNHNPIEYAQSVNSPVLLMHGMLDTRVSKEETERIADSFNKRPETVYFQKSEHCKFLVNDRVEWEHTVLDFLAKN